MYAKYVSNTTSVQAQVINDLALLLSGSPISVLSASCDKVNTTLLSTVAPGWTWVDSSASVGSVISAPDADALTTKLSLISPANAGAIALSGYETWNSTAHTGTNATVLNSAVIAYSATVANTYFLFATSRSFWVCPPTGAGFGSLEFTRSCAYLIGSTYSAFAVLNSTNLTGASGTPAYLPRMKNLAAAGDLVGSAVSVWSAYLAIGYSTYNGYKPVGVINDAANTPYYQVSPVWTLAKVGTLSAILGQFYDILEISSTAGATLDTFSDGTSTYVIVNMTDRSFAFKMA